MSNTDYQRVIAESLLLLKVDKAACQASTEEETLSEWQQSHPEEYKNIVALAEKLGYTAHGWCFRRPYWTDEGVGHLYLYWEQEPTLHFIPFM